MKTDNTINTVEKIKIACCGDSITFGLMATTLENSYPSVLQKLLGETYIVENFGRNGATVIADYDSREGQGYGPYINSAEYISAMASDPHIVILMLGMNDGNPTHCFNQKNGGAISEFYLSLYESTLCRIIDGFHSLATAPQIFLCKTSAMKRVVCETLNFDYIYHFTENLINIRKIQEKTARKYQIPLIDTLSDLDDPAYFCDGVHLTDMGYAQLATIVARNINKK